MKDKDISSLLSVLIPDRLQKPSDPQSDDKQPKMSDASSTSHTIANTE